LNTLGKHVDFDRKGSIMLVKSWALWECHALNSIVLMYVI